MDIEKINYFLKVFEDKKEKILEAYSNRITESNSVELSGDDVDNAQLISFKSISEIFSTRDASNLRKIHCAMDRIKSGSFGICIECEEDIGHSRLVAIPDCELCIVCAEDAEKRSKQYI